MKSAYFRIITEDGLAAWVRADEVGTFYETAVHTKRAPVVKPPKRGPGRPRLDAQPPEPIIPPKAVPVVCLLLRNGGKLYARDETLDTIANMLTQALGEQPTFIKGPVFEMGSNFRVPRPETNGAAHA
jgi:hypothetical protein